MTLSVSNISLALIIYPTDIVNFIIIIASGFIDNILVIIHFYIINIFFTRL